MKKAKAMDQRPQGQKALRMWCVGKAMTQNTEKLNAVLPRNELCLQHKYLRAIYDWITNAFLHRIKFKIWA